jgi:PAS domain S-box-containing protein
MIPLGPQPLNFQGRIVKSFKMILWIVVFTTIYFYSGKFGLSLAFVNASASPVWPPTGIAFAALLLWGYRLWPGIFIGAFLVNITTQGMWSTSLGIAGGNTLEAIVAVALVRRYAGGLKVFERPRTIFKFIFFAATISTVISATFGVTSLCLGNFAKWNQFPVIWLTWWLGDMNGDLIVAPFLVVWLANPFPVCDRKRILEGTGLLFTLILIGDVIFFGGNFFAPLEQMEYLTMLPLLWAAIRFGQRGAMTVAFILSAGALTGTLQGHGPFIKHDLNECCLLLCIFMGTITVTALVMTALVLERKKSERRLQVQDAVSRILAEAPTLDVAAPKSLQALCEIAGWDVSAIWTVNCATNELFVLGFWRLSSLKIPEFEAATRQRKFTPGMGLPGRVWSGGEPLWINIAEENEDCFPRRPMALKEGLSTGVCFPLKFNHEIFGVIECFSRAFLAPDENVLQMLAGIGDQIGQFIERKRAGEAMRESEQRFRQMAENINEVFWMTDSDKSQMLYISPTYEKIWGRSCESLYASPHSWAEALHPDDRERVLQSAVIKQISGQYDETYRIIRPDGAVRWVHDRAFPVLNESESISRIVGIAEDITDRKLAEARLIMFVHAVESTNEMVCITDLQDRFVFVNRAFQQGYGYTETEIFGKTPDILFSPNNPPELLREILEQTRLGGWRGELLDRRKDGTEFPIHLSTSLMRDQSGRKLGLMGISQDISERKQTEGRLQELAAIVQNSEDAIISTTPEAIVVSWNKGAERLFGYDIEEMVGKSVRVIFPAEQLNEAEDIISKVLRGESVESYEALRLHKNGTLRSVSVRVSAVTDPAGKITGVASIYRDITERKQLEKVVVEISANERRRIGHDLHDGLGQHLAGIAFKAKALEGALAGKFTGLASEASIIVSLVNEGIRQTRSLASGLDPVEIEVAGLPAALQKAAAQAAENFHVHCEFIYNQSRIMVDKQIGLVLYHITQESIHNAVTHGKSKHIVIELATDTTNHCLKIKDNGTGFDMKGRPQSGMGLRIMQYRANSVGGSLTVNSQVNAGTELVCIVPLSPINSALANVT